MTDLDLASVLRKTAAGVDAIKQRDRALTPKLRMLLIMVDGVKPVSELLQPLSGPQEAQQLIAQLLEAGFVHVVEVPTAAPTAVASVSTTSAPDDALKASIRRATRLLDEALGPDSVDLCMQLERCTSHAQFTAKVTEISRIVAAMRSERKGAEFLLAATN